MKRVVLQEPRWFSARRFPIPVRYAEEAIAAKLGNPVLPERDGQWIDVVSSESGNARSFEPDLLDGADSGRRACVPLPTDPMRKGHIHSSAKIGASVPVVDFQQF